MNRDINSTTPIGDIVANDFRTASIFKSNNIDFCCGGKKTLAEACLEKGVDQDKVKTELQVLAAIPAKAGQDYRSWKPDFLCDYIVNTHHRYVLKTMPDLVLYTRKIADVHGAHHPELIEVAALFAKTNTELLQHLKNEEEVLFPAIKSVLANNDTESKNTITSEIARMVGEHEFAGGAMDTINTLTHHYLLPEDSCGTYQVAFKLLEQFEDDLHIHVHLENNILYPDAIKLTL
ncbi:MAG TPA: iron-sulfur cluster repair di-iron protein [Prolixibacteraceae bacterium]|jgi:regulator of cell morphogenesis and NO signaling